VVLEDRLAAAAEALGVLEVLHGDELEGLEEDALGDGLTVPCPKEELVDPTKKHAIMSGVNLRIMLTPRQTNFAARR
jgi:hypothetical protein